MLCPLYCFNINALLDHFPERTSGWRQQLMIFIDRTHSPHFTQFFNFSYTFFDSKINFFLSSKSSNPKSSIQSMWECQMGGVKVPYRRVC